MREDGYYWVKDVDEWMVAKWNGECFELPGWELPVDGCDLEGIDENQILRSGYEK
jgi:hypothetical protein